VENHDYCEMFGGAVRVKQYLDGYRFSIDSVLLAWWPRFSPDAAIADIGTGCGVVSIILAAARGASNLTAFELQPDLASLTVENVRENNLSDRITIVEGDVRTLADDYGTAFDLAVCNPPFRELGSGRLSAGDQKAVARHELELTLAELVGASRKLLKQEGRLCLIYPTRRTAELFVVLPAAGLEPARVQFVHPRVGEPANLVLVEARSDRAAELVVEPPLYIYDGKEHTPEVAAMYDPPGIGR
jgi:tRNA1Val (adenine37-N6)-methyltransferase